MKHDFAFVEFSDPRDADDARYHLDGRELNGSRLIVEFAKGTPRGPGGTREYLGRGPPPGSGRCFNCGLDGHWARDCKAGDWKNKCYRCGERGHIERNCQNSPKKLKRGRSYSLSPVRSRSPHRGGSRCPSYSRRRRYSPSRSPKKERRDKRRSRSPLYSVSPEQQNSPSPSKISAHSPTPDEDSEKERDSPSPKRNPMVDEENGSVYSGSPRAKSGSPASPGRDNLTGEGYGTLPEANGHSESPENESSPVRDDVTGDAQTPNDNDNEDEISPARDDVTGDAQSPDDDENGRGSASP